MKIAKKAEIAAYEELNQMITASSNPRCLSRLISDRKSSQWWHLVTDDPEMGPSTAAITNLSFGKSLSSNTTQRPLLSPIVWAWKLTVVVWSYTLLAFYDACMMHDLFLVIHTDYFSLTLPHFTQLFGEKTTLELIANQTIYIETTVFSELKYLILTINWQ